MQEEISRSVERSGIQVIARAASILFALEGEQEGLSLGELAGRVGLARSTVQRIVAALTEEGLLISAGAKGRFTLGPRLASLVSTVQATTEQLARPVMEVLSRRLSETVDLSVLKSGSASFVEQVQGASRLVAISAIGQAFPLYCTANGKALLGCVSLDKRKRLLGGELRRLTESTLINPDAVLAEVADFLTTQLAWDREEHTVGICAVGTAFIDPSGRDFALSVPVPAYRFAAKQSEIASSLLAARDELLKRIPGATIPAFPS